MGSNNRDNVDGMKSRDEEDMSGSLMYQGGDSSQI
jgi:hypothetical protein